MTCKYCGKEFKITFNYKKEFCSHDCVQRYHREKNRKKRYCIVCGAEITGRRRVYCSEECLAKKQLENKKESYSCMIPKDLPKRRRKKSAKWAKELAEFNAKARALGLSYGQYEGQMQIERLRG